MQLLGHNRCIKNRYNTIDKQGCFFVIYSTEYDRNGNVVHDFLDIISEAVSMGYHYINTIVYPTTEVQNVAVRDNVRYLIWFCINRDEMLFDKDSIREKHIWKDVEWGKREKTTIQRVRTREMSGFQLKTMDAQSLQSIFFCLIMIYSIN